MSPLLFFKMRMQLGTGQLGMLKSTCQRRVGYEGLVGTMASRFPAYIRKMSY